MHAFDVLGDPVRRRILELLAAGELSSGEVVEAIGREFGITQAAVSQHLKILRDSGFATVRPEGQRRLYEAMPGWQAAVYAVAVWVGLSGAVMLLMRRAWARPFFIVSLVACLIQFGYSFLVLKAGEVLGSAAYPLPATIILVAIFLVWFSTMALKRGWLR